MADVEMSEAEVNAGNIQVPFGDYKDQTLWYVLRENPDYMEWMVNTVRTERAAITRHFIQSLLTFGKSAWVQKYLDGDINA